jgi:hypothetical protein
MLPQYVGSEIVLRENYAWALEKQENAEEAQIQKSETKRLSQEVKKRFMHSDFYGQLMAKRMFLLMKNLKYA